ncbi:MULTISPECIES: methionyl-tRNA formyltransferase [unclassified Mesorhizobium]|uniref:methionyl-tRNA formyltransferase n=3 Tax=Mesorhizobium TaxID=68287 RepID=UPI000F7634EE|nr:MULTISPECIES: methionyl-tRNA formyltransferase [unclassified Mesorhizobium]AZO04371.1 methionyl-tRNA formyltransferase [Mesorhizobium sp. M2A.F.Ca.ET.043.02.1.1]RUW40585.1 methionyl-tRNA formyltransferase [Mesorhizobium sp. M2A.F.Ca.ET.015.02.1.1]RUW80916.1 methionyl-tRNA formyltransferase [Mesorhizobium sp. M2A.F.Ca.ET.067.02.1.1]RVD08650.1 methionyl-tRNA formyltransferase [Mesorhizobium sp. M2A.F.Ca.ET.029.05.1.1]RWB45231.1 MAG: methionyl-tRNA formyltransferase [Mesorhizobium sp.]
MPHRVIFMGTPDFSVPTLRAIAEAGHEIAAVYTQPPRAAGRRGLELTPSPVQREAERLGLEVRTPTSLKGEAEQVSFAALQADVAVVVAYGLLLPKAILDAPRLGCLNGHASLLPRWRGAAPIRRAVMAGDALTGIMVMKMEEGLDTGPVALVEKVAIAPDMTAGELHDRLMVQGASLMVEALAQLGINCLTFTPQAAEGVTYARKIDKSETRVDWTRPSGEVHNHIRGLSPFPGAWCEVEIGGRMERLKLLRSALSEGVGESGGILDDRLTVACGSGAVRLVEVQRAGGKPAAAQEFLRGAKIAKGTKLT